MTVRPKVSLNSSRPLHAFPREGTSHDESPALTAVLQAQRAAIVAASLRSEAKQRAARVAVRAAVVRERLIERALEPDDLTDAAVSAATARCARDVGLCGGRRVGRKVRTASQEQRRGAGYAGDQ